MTDTTPDIPGVIAPPPLIAAATVALGLLLDWIFPVYVLSVLLLFWPRLVIGLLLLAAGAGLAFAGERNFRHAGTNVPPWQPALKLVDSGIHGYLRNPMYVGMALMIGGLAIALANDWMLVLLVPAALLIHYGVVLREERYLEAKFGEPYRRYMHNVPRYGWPDRQ